MPPSIAFATYFMTRGVLVNTCHRTRALILRLSLRLRFTCNLALNARLINVDMSPCVAFTAEFATAFYMQPIVLNSPHTCTFTHEYLCVCEHAHMCVHTSHCMCGHDSCVCCLSVEFATGFVIVFHVCVASTLSLRLSVRLRFTLRLSL